MENLCPHCGADNRATARYCRLCGRPCVDGVIRSATRVTPVMEQWRQLSHALTRREIRKLLGEPMRREMQDAPDGVQIEIWRYEYEIAGPPETRVTGTIELYAAEGRIITWTEPDWSRLGPPTV